MTDLKEANPRVQGQIIKFPDDALKLKCPFKLIINGPSGIGKSSFCQSEYLFYAQFDLL